MIDLYLFRHAESWGNVNNHLIGGQSNHYELTERGQAQAHKLGKRLAQESFSLDQLHSSTAVRAKHTASILSEYLNLPESQIGHSDKVLELSHGEWEGKLRSEYLNDTTRAQRAANPWDFSAPGGESPRDVENRMYQWVQETVYPHQDENLKIGLVTHGMSIRCLFRRLMKADPGTSHNIVVHNTSITHFQYYPEKDRWFLARLNDYSHIIVDEFIGHYG